MVRLASLVAAGIGPTQARLFEAPLGAAFARFGIDTPRRQAAFVAQCAHESCLFTALEEGLYYRTPERICAIFRSTVPTVARASKLACNPKLLANCVYANRNGNRDEASGDGWRYRGRGLIQLTGRANYARAAAALERPYLEQPDLVLEPADACLSAAWFWHVNGLNALADAGRIDDITRAINGRAMAGAAERRHLFEVALAAFEQAAAVSRAPREDAGALPRARTRKVPRETERREPAAPKPPRVSVEAPRRAAAAVRATTAARPKVEARPAPRPVAEPKARSKAGPKARSMAEPKATSRPPRKALPKPHHRARPGLRAKA